ncbi:hypothetical protein [Streptomyces pacificus]|uniref:Uncharacterized protein n=1 Tax=Streptomyces pacificus TaxID=2705029 RepID=A0A6A0APK2_9ACTN|nr:hypothetical protein [Streptomyces pacificus]GFH34772.1 hypothetical protein SCWH03_09860 [Streptomyces pacificus]
MTIARHLAIIEILCSRPFPVVPGRSEVGASAPGYHTAELGRSGQIWGDRSDGEAVEEQFEAEREALAAVLSTRWGPPQVFGLGSVLARSVGEEHIPEPWGMLSASVPDVHLWRAGGRWVVLGVSRWGTELTYQLLATVTEVDPP